MADMNKAEKLAAARRKLKEYQKKNRDTTIKSDSEKRTSKATSYGGTKGPYEQSYVFDSGTGESSPNEPVSSSPVPPTEAAAASNGYRSSVSPPLATSRGLFSNDVMDSRDFFDNLPSRPVEEPARFVPAEDPPVCGATGDAIVSSEMPERNIGERDPAPDVVRAASVPEDSPASSSTESLRQLSLQMNGLMEDATDLPGSASAQTVLERRNQELAALLAEREQLVEQLQLQLKEYQSRTSQLQVDMNQLQAESETRLARELHPVQEQLQLHIQTVGILVGEKTELQAALGKSQQTAKQKAAEVEELQGRLKASRHKVTELEKELATLGGAKERLESGTAEQARDQDRLRSENASLKKRLEEAEEEASELSQKLNAKTMECSVLQNEVQENQSQVDLLQLKVQQLTTSDRPDVDHLLEAMHQQKVALEWQVSELQQTVKSMGVDREQATRQYQDYLQRFNSQLNSLSEKLAATTAENERLANREQSLVRHVSELEKQLQQQQTQRTKDESKEAESITAALQAEKQQLLQQLDQQLQEKLSLQSELEGALKQIELLEGEVEALQADQPDTSRLLAAMESDKVAAAQAVGQNQKLKIQLEELQDSFVKMSNDKMELTEHLQSEQHVNREQGEQLARLEEELQDGRTQLEQKEQLVLELQKTSSELLAKLTAYGDQTKQLEEHARLLEDLRQAKARIETLTSQNCELQARTGAPDRKDDMLASLSASVRQLELERDQLQHQLQHSDPHVLPHPDVDPKSYISMKEAMEKLESRFTKTMQEVAELSDEKQKLEHIVLQLQGETETIGEYIALYQAQRTMLRQRAQEKDQQLSRLRRDREEMKMKLNELTNLVQSLVAGKSDQHQAIPVDSQGLANGDVDMKSDSPEDTEPAVPKDQAADKIMALLSEIGSSNLVEPQMKGMESFHPCPWCSGRLITV